MADTAVVTSPVADDGLLRTIKDLVAGAAGGVTQVMVGMLWVLCCAALMGFYRGLMGE